MTVPNEEFKNQILANDAVDIRATSKTISRRLSEFTEQERQRYAAAVTQSTSVQPESEKKSKLNPDAAPFKADPIEPSPIRAPPMYAPPAYPGSQPIDDAYYYQTGAFNSYGGMDPYYNWYMQNLQMQQQYYQQGSKKADYPPDHHRNSN